MGIRSEVGARGFTLIELIVTLLVIAVAIGLVAPAISRSTEAVRARAEVAGFSATLRHAREQAITTRQEHKVLVSLIDRHVTVVTGEDEVRWTRAFSARLTIQPTTPSSLTIRFHPQGTSSGSDLRLTSGAVTYHLTVDAVTGRVRNQRE